MFSTLTDTSASWLKRLTLACGVKLDRETDLTQYPGLGNLP
jgi:hypothetical protein